MVVNWKNRQETPRVHALGKKDNGTTDSYSTPISTNGSVSTSQERTQKHAVIL